MENKPPLFPTWGDWYALVLGTLAVVVVVFTLLTEHYR